MKISLIVISRVLLVLFAILAGLENVLGQDSATTRAIEAVGEARQAQIMVNQVDVSRYPDINIFAAALRDGAPVAGLHADDFKVKEDEVEQGPILVTPKLTSLSAVVALDTSGSMSRAMEAARRAAANFVSRLGSDDQVAIVSFARTVQTLSGFNAEKTGARKAIGSTTARGDTALYDATYRSIELLKTRQGRKVAVILSDGKDDDGTGKPLSKKTIEDVLTLAKELNVPVFTIGLGSEMDRASLVRIAQESGGLFQEAPTADDLIRLYESIGRQLSGQYSISYRSNLPADGSVHRIQLGWGGITSIKEYVSPGERNVVSLREATATLVPDLGLEGSPQEVTPGVTFDTAQADELNRMLFDKRQLPQMGVRYFAINVLSGKRYLMFFQMTAQNGSWEHSTAELFNGRRDRVLSFYGYAQDPWSSFSETFSGVEGATQPYYVAIKARSPFYFAVYEYDAADAGSGRDSSINNPLPLTLGVPVTGNFGMNDLWDSYTMTVEVGKRYLLKARPSATRSLHLVVTDSNGVEINTVDSQNGGALTTLEFTANSTDMRVKIGWDDNVPFNTAYGLVIGGPDVLPPPQPAVPAAPMIPKLRSN